MCRGCKHLAGCLFQPSPKERASYTTVHEPLLEPRPSNLVMIFDIFDGLFEPIFTHAGASGLQKSIPDNLTDLGTRNESSGACLGPDFGHFRQKFEQFSKISNFKIKKSQLQSLNFLIRSFLSER